MSAGPWIMYSECFLGPWKGCKKVKREGDKCKEVGKGRERQKGRERGRERERELFPTGSC